MTCSNRENRWQRSHENHLRWNFGRWVAKGYVSNVTLIAAEEDPGIALELGETAIARIALTSRSQSLLVTDQRLALAGCTLVRFDDVIHCFWIERNRPVDISLKREEYHRLIFELRGGGEIIVEGLGQAAFPLLSFFWHHLGLRKDGR